MEDKKMVVDNKLGLFDFMVVVNDLTYEYFDFNGVYQPHIGMLNAMRLYYNNCVKESRFDERIPHDVDDVGDMEEVISDKEFIENFNKAINIGKEENSPTLQMDFGTAYMHALDMVKVKQTSIERIIDILKEAVDQFGITLEDELGKGGLNKLLGFVQNIRDGKITGADILR